jgi:predicted glycosyltransferase
VLTECGGLDERGYVLIRLSAWNTLHDVNHSGMGAEVERFIDHFKERFKIVICAEENRMPERLRQYAMRFPPEKFHDVLWYARFVLTEGASTASEAACLGVPTVYVNSTESRGYLDMLEKDYGLVRGFSMAKPGVDAAIDWLAGLDVQELEGLRAKRVDLFNAHEDVTAHIVNTLERMAAE